MVGQVSAVLEERFAAAVAVGANGHHPAMAAFQGPIVSAYASFPLGNVAQFVSGAAVDAAARAGPVIHLLGVRGRWEHRLHPHGDQAPQVVLRTTSLLASCELDAPGTVPRGLILPIVAVLPPHER